MLVLDAERHLAGRQHPQLRHRVEQRPHQDGHRAEDVLAVVEQQHRPGSGQPLAQRLLTAGTCRVSATTCASTAVASTASSRTSQTPPGALSRRHLEGQPGLADAGDADHRHQPVLAEGRGHARQVVGMARPAGAGRPAGCPGPRRHGARGRLEVRALLQHLLLERAQAVPGSMPSSSTSSRRTRAYAASASACRPDR